MFTLLLFDIDGTLISASRAGIAAYQKGMEAAFGIHVSLDGIRFCGKTDPINFREILARHGLDPRLAENEKLTEAYLRHLEIAVAADPGVVCPGVRSLLGILAGRPELRLALGTGNLERGAWIKLAVHGLDAYFQTGGFGDDAPDRTGVIAAGIKRAEEKYRVRFERIVVVGDTPLDVDCATGNGAHSIAVATGTYSREELWQAGASLVLPDLARTEAFLSALEILPPA